MIDIPIPLIVYAATAGVVTTGAGIYYFVKTSDGAISEVTEEAANAAIEGGAQLIQTTLSQLVPILENAASEFKDAGIDLIKYAGPALIDGIGNTYEAARNVLRGKEDDIIAGFTVGLMAILTLVYVYQSVKKAGDAI